MGHIPNGGDDPFLSLAVQGKYAYLIQGNVEKPKRLHVVDISDPSQPRIVGSSPLTDSAMHLAVSGNHVYVLDEPNFRVFDVSNPAAPRDVGSCELGKLLWDLVIQGRYAYVTDVESVRVIHAEHAEVSGDAVYLVGDDGFSILRVVRPGKEGDKQLKQ